MSKPVLSTLLSNCVERCFYDTRSLEWGWVNLKHCKETDRTSFILYSIENTEQCVSKYCEKRFIQCNFQNFVCNLLIKNQPISEEKKKKKN